MKLKFNLTTQIVVALVLGCVVGMLLQGNAEITTTYIQPIGTIFLNLLKFIVVPLVLISIVVGLISMKNISALGRLGLRTLIYFMATTLVAVVLGLAVSTLLKDFFPIVDINVGQKTCDVDHIDFISQIVDFFPCNAIEPISKNLMMQVIVIALFVGLAIVKVGEKAKPFAELLISLNEVTIAILGFIMRLAPVGVFCLLCPVVAENGSMIFGSYAVLLGVDYLCFFLHAIVVYALCVWLIGKIRPVHFFHKMFPAMMFAFSSDSSLATLPVTTQCCKDLGVRSGIGNFVLPLGATINMDGVAIYLGVTAVFIAKCCGIDLTFSQYAAIAFSSTIASIGTPGIPGGSLALMAMVFASGGIPVEGVAIAAGIDRLVDMGRTTMSITGDASCAVIMENMERRSEAKSLETTV